MESMDRSNRFYAEDYSAVEFEMPVEQTTHTTSNEVQVRSRPVGRPIPRPGQTALPDAALVDASVLFFEFEQRKVKELKLVLASGAVCSEFSCRTLSSERASEILGLFLSEQAKAAARKVENENLWTNRIGIFLAVVSLLLAIITSRHK